MTVRPPPPTHEELDAALVTACCDTRVDVIMCLLQLGASLTSPNVRVQALLNACASNDEKVLNTLLNTFTRTLYDDKKALGAARDFAQRAGNESIVERLSEFEAMPEYGVPLNDYSWRKPI
jgi:hypothetical protein